MQKPSIIRNSIFLILICLIFTHCKPSEKPGHSGNPSAEIEKISTSEAKRMADPENNPVLKSDLVKGDDHLPEDFLEFYDKFHSDIDFQKSHINWPLKGLPSDPGGEKKVPDNFFWNKGKWVMHHRVKTDNEFFVISYANIDNKMIIERVESTQAPLRMERRFAKLSDGKWTLIYYMGMRMLSEEKFAN